MPTRTLPSSVTLERLEAEAAELCQGHAIGAVEALQRIREFYPGFEDASDSDIAWARFEIADARLAIAREYGFEDWARLSAHLSSGGPAAADRSLHARIADVVMRIAVALVDAGDLDGLRRLLASHPDLVHRQARFEGLNYFTSPTLLEFVAGNPIRHDRLPANIVDIAGAILDAGAKSNRRAVDSTLELVCSGRLARECGVQIPLIDLLCAYGADPDAAMLAALVHGEFDAVDALIRHRARVDLVVAAGTGDVDAARRTLRAANAGARHRALALAAQHGHVEIVRLLVDEGEDPDRYNPSGCHSHATPLHQAALAGHEKVVRLLVARGARLDMPDLHHNGTPADWAEYAGHHDIAVWLRARA